MASSEAELARRAGPHGDLSPLSGVEMTTRGLSPLPTSGLSPLPILKADCGFGLDDSKSSDALLLRCSDAEGGQDRASGFDRPSTLDLCRQEEYIIRQ